MRTLLLTEDEVKALCTVCRRVGGSPEASARGLIDSVHAKLYEGEYLEYEELLTGHLKFKDFPPDVLRPPGGVPWKGKLIPVSILDSLAAAIP